MNRNPSAYARHQRAVEESQSKTQVNYKLACFTSTDDGKISADNMLI